MRKQNSVFKTAFTSEADKNLKNTDSFGYVELDKYACYVIADGIDDQVDGMSAKLAVDTIISAFTEAPSMRKGALRRYLRSANKALLTADSKMRLKASVTVDKLCKDAVWAGGQHPFPSVPGRIPPGSVQRSVPEHGPRESGKTGAG